MHGISKLKLIEIANRVPLFKALSAYEKDQVISIPRIIKVINAGEKFISYGDYTDNFYILLSGIAKVHQKGNEIATIEGGQFVGEVGFICAEPRTANVIAETDLITFCIDKRCFLMLPVLLREKIKDKLINGLVQRIEHMNNHITHLNNQIDILLPSDINEQHNQANEINSQQGQKNTALIEESPISINEFLTFSPTEKPQIDELPYSTNSEDKSGSPWCETVQKK